MADTIQFQIMVNGIPETVKNVNDLDLIIKDLAREMKSATVGTAQFERTLKELGAAKVMRTNLMATASAMGGMRNQTAQAGVALQNLNFVIRDSPFFFKDLQLGVLAVGNNINPLIDSFQRLKLQAAEMTAETGKTVTAFSLLKKSLAGPLGLSVAMSLIVTAFQAVVFAMGNANRESKKLEEQLKKEKDQVSRLRSEWLGLVKDRVLASKDQTSPDRLLALREEKKRVKEIIAEYEHRLNFGSKTTETEKELKKDIEAEKRELERINNEMGFILFAWQKVYDEQEKHKKKVKEIKYEYQQFNSALEYFNYLMSLQGDIRGELVEKRRKEMEGWEDLSKAMERSADKHKEATKDLKILTTVSNQFGQALINAVMMGRFEFESLLQSIAAAIAQMLILKAITATLFGGGLPGGVGLPFIGPLLQGAGNASPAGVNSFVGPRLPINGLNKSTNINVEGRISMQKNKFVVDLDKAKRVQRTNYGVGRGDLLET